ncbi:MAG: DUF3781 domain-containing protein [Arenicella sp.]|nr:DUF3781 domain-containing protein [Arenicella sp.]
MNNYLQITISDNFRNTELGIFRIKRNLQLPDLTVAELEAFLKNVLLSTPLDKIETRGKNHYFTNDNHNAVLTINSGSLTIITAKKIITKEINGNSNLQ